MSFSLANLSYLAKVHRFFVITKRAIKKEAHRTQIQCASAILCCAYSICAKLSTFLYDALSHHSLSNLHEACNVCTLHVVHIAISLGAVLHAVLVEKARMKTSFMSQIPEPNPKAMIKAGLFCLFPSAMNADGFKISLTNIVGFSFLSCKGTTKKRIKQMLDAFFL